MAVVTKRNFSRAHLDAMLDRAIEENGSVIIKRPGRPDLAVISAERLRSFDTTEYILASPKNRRRLATALRDARSGRGKPMSVRQLGKQVGLDK